VLAEMQVGQRQRTSPEEAVVVLRSFAPGVLAIPLVAKAKLGAEREVDVAYVGQREVLEGRPWRQRIGRFRVATAEIAVVLGVTNVLDRWRGGRSLGSDVRDAEKDRCDDDVFQCW